MENWNSTAFRGITVRDFYLFSLCHCHQPIFFSLLFFSMITSNTYLYTTLLVTHLHNRNISITSFMSIMVAHMYELNMSSSWEHSSLKWGWRLTVECDIVYMYYGHVSTIPTRESTKSLIRLWYPSLNSIHTYLVTPSLGMSVQSIQVE